jgi:hypothetical protein
MHLIKKFNKKTFNSFNTFKIFNGLNSFYPIIIKNKFTNIIFFNKKNETNSEKKLSFTKTKITNKSFSDFNKSNININKNKNKNKNKEINTHTNTNTNTNINTNINTNKDIDINIDMDIEKEYKDLKNKLLNKNFNFTKEDSNLNELNYKEELFEFTANNYYDINDEEINIILNKLKDKKILEAEIKDFKFFTKNILLAYYNNENFTLKQSTFFLFIKYYLNVIKEIKIYLDPNYLSMENNSFDLFFDNINASLLNKAITNISNETNISDFIYFFQILNLINFSNLETKHKFVEYLQINFLLLSNLNIDFDNNINNDNNKSNIILYLLENINFYLSNKIPLDENFLQILNFFTEKISLENNIDYIFNESLIKRRKIKKFSGLEITYFSYLYGFLNEFIYNNEKENKKNMDKIKDNNSVNISDTDKLKDNINDNKKKEKIFYLKNENRENFFIIENLLRKIEQIFIFSNKITKENLLKRYLLNKENLEKILGNSIEDLYKNKESYIDSQMNSIMEKTLQYMKIIK